MKLNLYHGSKAGINGIIQPISRELCDFGRGFYMGTEKSQPLTLICNFPHATLYEIEFDLNSLSLFSMDVNIDWALLIAYNRGKMENVKNSPIYEKYSTITKNYDVIIGYIANDRMFTVLERFFLGDITDVALVKSLAALQLGKQYVAITQKACNQIHILNQKIIDTSERNQWLEISNKNRREGITMAEEICRKYRREGRFFDEIIAKGV